MTTVKCPQCGHEFSPDEVLTHELEEQIRSKLAKEIGDKAKEEASKELFEKEEQIKALRLRAKESEEFEKKLRAEKLAMEEAKEKFELEKTRQLDLDRAKIKEEAEKAVLEKDKYRFDEYEKKIHDMQKSLEEAQRKGNQGSQQLQGEVQELDIENTLRRLNPFDEIIEVKKGENGADIRQTVITKMGNICGKIIWESKRTKAWSEGWVSKLKEDMIRDKAQIGVIVTNIMPNDINNQIGNRNGIWIIKVESVEPLSQLLSEKLTEVAKVKSIAIHKQTTAETLYDYVTSSTFNQNVERIVGVYLEMKAQIAKEAASAERGFKQRNMQVDMLLSGMTGIYGEMQGIAGSSLPPIALLESV